MAYIDQLVNIAISIASGGLTRAAFGVANFASYHLAWTDRIRFYSSTTAVAVDFPTTSPEYLAAVAYFSQTPAPTSLAISRLQLDAVTVDVTGTTAYDDTHEYTVTINGTEFASTGAGSAILTAAALETAINGGAEPVTADDTAADGTFTLTADVAATAFTLVLDSFQDWVLLTAGETWTNGLIAIRNSSNAWYGLAINSRVEADILLVAAWTQTNLKLYAFASLDVEIIDTSVSVDTGSIVQQIYDLGYTRTIPVYHSKADGATNEQWIEVAFFGENLTVDLDVQTSTWAFSQLIGITADDLTDTQIQNAIGTVDAPTSGKNCNIYIPVAGANIIQRGQVAEGEWIDTIIGIDWLRARIQEGVYAALIGAKAASKKIPYTDKGIPIIANEVIAVLKRGQTTELLDFDIDLNATLGFSVTWPKKSDVSAADLSARYLRNVNFVATLAGAIHATRITGTVGV